MGFELMRTIWIGHAEVGIVVCGRIVISLLERTVGKFHGHIIRQLAGRITDADVLERSFTMPTGIAPRLLVVGKVDRCQHIR